MKQILIKIMPNGEIEAETKGMKGKTCLKYLSEIEKMTDAVTTDSKFTDEYLELEQTQDNSQVLESEVEA